MALARLNSICLALILTTGTALSQGGRELPVEKPKERTNNEAPKLRVPTKQAPNVSTVFVLLNPIVPGQVTIKSSTGKLIKQGEADAKGEASFSLTRGQAYQIEASSPGYSSGIATVKPATASSIVRINLDARSRVLRFLNLPTGASILVDNKEVPSNTIAGITTVADLTPSKHKVTVQHPEFNEFKTEVDLSRVGIGESITFSLELEKTARLTIQSVPGADVMIDGVIKGRVPSGGSIAILFPVTQVAEHVISAERPGYISKSVRERLTPGARTLVLDLEPFANPEGSTDGFDSLNQWSVPPTWKVLPSANNRTLQVSGTKIGVLKDKVYKDFQAVFTLWIPDGKGATWAMKADAAGTNYYLFHLSGPKATAPFIPNRFYTYVVRDGKEPVEVNQPTPLVVDLNSTSSFLIHIVAHGYEIEHSITSNETGEKVTLGHYTDSSATKDKFLYGLFGFRSFLGETFVVDDFTIDPSKETVPVLTRPR